MIGEDPFEKRIRHLPQRPIPPSWRAEILSATRHASRSAPPPRATNNLAPRWRAVLASVLWPHPGAWAALATVWLLVLGLNWTTSEARPAVASQAAPLSPQMRELLREQERMLAELIGPARTPEAERPKSATPQPRSQRRELFVNT